MIGGACELVVRGIDGFKGMTACGYFTCPSRHQRDNGMITCAHAIARARGLKESDQPLELDPPVEVTVLIGEDTGEKNMVLPRTGMGSLLR